MEFLLKPRDGPKDPMKHTQESNFKMTFEITGTKDYSKPIFFLPGDRIDGFVRIAVDKATAFDEIEILLQGTSEIRPQWTAPDRFLESQHVFLNLQNSTDGNAESKARAMKSKSSIRLPFKFVIPHQLPPQSCQHPKNNPDVERSHLSLPPSLGGLRDVDDPKQREGDLAPRMTTIYYAIRVRVIQRSQTGRGSNVLADVAEEICIMPTTSGNPLDIPSAKMQGSQVVEDTFMKEKDGELTVKILNDLTIELKQVSRFTLVSPIQSALRVAFRYIAKADEKPPQLEDLKIYFCVHHFYAKTPFTDIPNEWVSKSYKGAGDGNLATDRIALPTWSLRAVNWTKDLPASEAYEDLLDGSDAPDLHKCKSTQSMIAKHVYSVILHKPFPHPESTFLAPTFHSCLISRTFSLELVVSYHRAIRPPATGFLAFSPPVFVKVPPRATGHRSSASSEATSAATS